MLGLYVFSDKLLDWCWVIFQLLMVPIVIEFFFSKVSDINDSLNTLSEVDDKYSLIIVNIRVEGEPTFKDWRKKVAEWFIYKEYVLYS